MTNKGKLQELELAMNDLIERTTICLLDLNKRMTALEDDTKPKKEFPDKEIIFVMEDYGCSWEDALTYLRRNDEDGT